MARRAQRLAPGGGGGVSGTGQRWSSGRGAGGWGAGLRRSGGRPDGTGATDALADLVAALRSGASPEEAWPRVLGVPVRRGVPVEGPLAAAVGARAAVAVVAAARLSHELGAPPAAVLDAVLAGAEADSEADGRRRAALAAPRASARVLAWLPALGLLLGLAMGVDPVAVLLDGGAGTVALLTGVTSSALGTLWTRRLVAAAERAADA